MTAPVRERTRGWDRLRYALLVAWLVVGVGALVLGERPSSRGELDEGVRSGSVEQVRVVGGLPPGVVGHALQQVHWRDGLVRRWYEVQQVSPGTSPTRGLPSSTGEVGAELAQAHPGLRVDRVAGPYQGFTLGGRAVPGWVPLLAVVVSVLSLVAVALGPEPWRATRWAWFWLLSTPVGAAAFLLLSGPTPGVRHTRDPARRLTGGWGLLLAALLGGGATRL